MPRLLRPLATTWIATALLPIPVLLITDPARNAEVSCIYLGLGSAWLATEILRYGGYPDSRYEWRIKTISIGVAVIINAALFSALGVAVSVKSNIPLPLMAAFAVIPAVGLVPWMAQRIRDPFKAIVFSAFILMAAKLAACVVARFVYGPDFMERGYVAADWRSAKLMISLTWTLVTATSLALLVHNCWRFKLLNPSTR